MNQEKRKTGQTTAYHVGSSIYIVRKRGMCRVVDEVLSR